MKKVVCVVDNHIYLQYGKVYNAVGETDKDYTIKRNDETLLYAFRWKKKFFVSLEEFRKEQIEKILE